MYIYKLATLPDEFLVQRLRSHDSISNARSSLTNGRIACVSCATRLAGGCIAAAAAVVSAASSAGELPHAKPHHAHNYTDD